MHISSLSDLSLNLDFSYSISDNMHHGCPGNLSVSETFPGINLPLRTLTLTLTYTSLQHRRKKKKAHMKNRNMTANLFRSGKMKKH